MGDADLKPSTDRTSNRSHASSNRVSEISRRILKIRDQRLADEIPRTSPEIEKNARQRLAIVSKDPLICWHFVFTDERESAITGHPSGLDGSGARLALRRHPVASRRKVRAQDELALETARLETAVCLGDLIEGDPPGDTGPNGATCQQAEEPLQVLPEPGGMPRPHHVDRVEAGTLAARQEPPQIQARNGHEDGEHALLRLH